MGLLVPRLDDPLGAAKPQSHPSASRLPRCAHILFFLGLALATSSAALADRPKPGPAGFSIDLPVAASKLLKVVVQVAQDESIHGTFQYEKESVLSGASAVSSSNAFEAWTGPGQVFYKVHTEALSPAHFPGSGDVGTVTVRYIVQELTPESSRLRIHAVFVENGRHRHHPSDGSVETSEFSEIAKHLQAIEKDEEQAQQQRQTQAQEQELNQLRSALEEEKLRLEAARNSLHQLEHRAAALRRELMARVKSPGVELKTAPYNHAATLQTLARGEEVMVLLHTPYWYGVRRQQGQQGWVYYIFLESLP